MKHTHNIKIKHKTTGENLAFHILDVDMGRAISQISEGKSGLKVEKDGKRVVFKTNKEYMITHASRPGMDAPELKGMII